MKGLHGMYKSAMPTIDGTVLFRDVQRILTGADFSGGAP
jgi:hypothetical protein